MARYNPNRAKINRSYTFEELAEVFGVHKNTVSAWVKNGLPCLHDKRPYLILGAKGSTPSSRTVLNRPHTASPVWPLAAVFAGCGTSRCS